MSSNRINVKALLADPDLRRKLMVSTIQATQAREGIETSPEQADRAYYVVTEAERTAFFELERFKGGKKGDKDKRHEMFVKSLRTQDEMVRHDIARRDFASIDGSPLAYRRVSLVASVFRDYPPLEPAWGIARQGKATADDTRWLRLRWEVTGRHGWVNFAKGGDFSRFYYDHDLMLDWREEHRAELKASGNGLPSLELYFRPGITWPRRTAKGFNARRMPVGCVFADKGPALFAKFELDEDFLLGILNSIEFEFLFTTKTSFSWEVGIIKTLPIPRPTSEQHKLISSLAREIYDAKASWDEGNELSARFSSPWCVHQNLVQGSTTLADRLDGIEKYHAAQNAKIATAYDKLNLEVYRLYGVSDVARVQLEQIMGERAPEIIWPQMEGKTSEQKRMEHVWRLLSFAVKRVVEVDDDGIVAFGRSTGDTPLVERVREELAALFPGRDESQIEVEIVNELRRSVKGYRKCATLDDWLANAFFEYHTNLYKSRPIYWHIASAQGAAPFAFGAIVHYHRFDKNRMAKLRANYVRDTIEELRRDAGLADKAGRTDDRVELQARLEEVQALDKKLQQIQEGYHEGPEGGEHDFRILTPWKEPSDRPRGWVPDLDDGVKVNITPLDRAGVLRVKGVAG